MELGRFISTLVANGGTGSGRTYGMNEIDADGIYIADLFGMINRRRRLIMALVAASIVLCTIFLLLQDQKFTATITLQPAEANAAGGAGFGPLAGIGGLGGLAALTSSETTPFDKFNALLFSRSTAERMMKCCDLMSQAFAAQWDPEGREWHAHKGVGGYGKRMLRRLRGLVGWRKPDVFSFQNYLKERVSVSQVGGTSLMTLSFEHKDGEFARQLIASLHRQTDDLVRERLVQDNEVIVEYSRGLLQDETQTTSRSTLVNLILEREQTLIYLQTSRNYTADIVDEAITLADPTWPRPLLSYAVAVVLSIFAGVSITIVIGLRDVKFFASGS